MPNVGFVGLVNFTLVFFLMGKEMYIKTQQRGAKKATQLYTRGIQREPRGLYKNERQKQKTTYLSNPNLGIREYTKILTIERSILGKEPAQEVRELIKESFSLS